MSSARFVALGLACSSLVPVACGGKAVIDASGGAGGAGGSTSTTSAPSCDALHAELLDAIADARACDPMSPAWQCDGTAFVFDSCQCQVLANQTKPDAVQKALQAFDAWVAQNCGPWTCDACPPFGAGDCMPSAGGPAECQPGVWGG